jgi:hypothetical protein
MMVWLYRNVNSAPIGGAEIDGNALPPVDQLFMKDGYPLVCVAHVADDDYPGVVYRAPSPEVAQNFVSARVESAAREHYRARRDVSNANGSQVPDWEEADELDRIRFRIDAEANLLDPVPAGRN